MRRIVCALCMCCIVGIHQSAGQTPVSDFVVDSIISSRPVLPVLRNKAHNTVLRIRIDVPRDAFGSILDGLNLVIQDTAAIKSIQVFQGTHALDHDTGYQFGTTQEPQTELRFNDDRSLEEGSNYFWVSCQLKSTAYLQQKIKISCSLVSINGVLHKPYAVERSSGQRVGHALRQHGDMGVDAFRIPGLATTNGGTLIAVYDVRKNSAIDLQEDIDVGMSRSLDGGESWEPMKIIMDMGQWGGKGPRENGIGDPSILVDRRTNTIWVAAVWAHGHPGKRNWFASKPGIAPSETSQFVLVKSEDDGKSWSAPVNITTQIKEQKWHLLLQGPGKGITMKNGTLVFPAQFKDHQEVPYSTIIYSTDHGKNWAIGTGLRKETTESQVVELADGSLMINARNNEARGQQGIGRVVATSKDMGKSWQEHPSSIAALEESTCMASLIHEQFKGYGQVLLFSNPNTADGRYDITIKASTDEGHTWPMEYWLLLDEGQGRGYSCLTKIDDQTLGILYESSQADLVFEKIALSEIIK